MINIKRLIFISLFFSVFFGNNIVFAQKTNQFDANKKRTGVWKKYYKNKRIRYSGEFKDGKEIGIVTSGTMSPSLNKGIGMGYVPKELSKPDSEIYIQVRKKQLKAKVVKMPFK